MRLNTDVNADRLAENLAKAETMQKYGLFFQQMGELSLAVSVYNRILDLGGDNVQLRFNLGSAKLNQIRPTEALEQFKAGIRMRPDEPGLRLGMANASKLLGDFSSAESHLEDELEVCPESVNAAINLGWLLEEQNRIPEALVQYRKAMYYNLNDANLRWNHGLVCLALGDYSRGWRDYEYRWVARNKQKPEYNSPAWNGDALGEKTLLLHTEQGFGDSIMFYRFAHKLAEAGSNLILHCQPALKRLFSSQSSNVTVLDTNMAPPAHDVHASLMSLPFLMELDKEEELCLPKNITNQYKSVIDLDSTDLSNKKIAITWTSQIGSETGEKKSIPYSKFKQLFDVPNCEFYSVQINSEATAIAEMNCRSNVHNLEKSIHDFKDTADLLSSMDLVISVDTAVAHLSGTLEIPTWVILPFAADWRWRIHRADSPWYPTMRLFRQKSAGNWDTVLEEVKHCLSNYGKQMSPHRLAPHLTTA